MWRSMYTSIYISPLPLSEESVYKSDQNKNLIFQWPELFDLVFNSFFNSRLSIALTWLSKLFDPLEQLESEFDWDNFESWVFPEILIVQCFIRIRLEISYLFIFLRGTHFFDSFHSFISRLCIALTWLSFLILLSNWRVNFSCNSQYMQ